jgi:hypothetical protein
MEIFTSQRKGNTPICLLNQNKCRCKEEIIELLEMLELQIEGSAIKQAGLRIALDKLRKHLAPHIDRYQRESQRMTSKSSLTS